MDSTRSTYSNYGRSANWAAGQSRIDIKEQRIAGIQTDLATVNSQRRNANTFVFPFPWPDNQAASFLQRFVQEKDVEWNGFTRQFSRHQDMGIQQENVNRIWSESLHWSIDLERSLVAFKSKVGQDRTSSDNALGTDNYKSTEPQSWSDLMQRASKELDDAKRQNHMASMLPSKILKSLDDLEQSLNALFDWLGGLPTEKHRQAHCRTITSIISATADGAPLHDFTLSKLAEMATLFSDATEYISLCGLRRLNLPLVQKSSCIYDIFSKGLIMLLDATTYKESGRQAARKQNNDIKRIVERLQKKMMSANGEAKELSIAGAAFDNVGTILDDQPPTNLNIINNYYFLLNASPLHCSRDSENEIELAMRDTAGPETRSRKRRRIASLCLKSGKLTTHQNQDGAEDPSSSNILKLLQYNPDSVTRYIDLHASSDLVSHSDLRRLSTATHSSIFQQWLKGENEASALLMHGDFELADGFSPFTFLCSALFRSYDASTRIIVLTAFCEEQHDEKSAPPHFRGPCGVLVNFIGQLLIDKGVGPLVNTAFLQHKQLAKMSQYDFKELCHLFLEIIEQLHAHALVLFCAIDSFSTYRTRDMETLLSTLREIVNSQRGDRRRRKMKMVFKLLVTDLTVTSEAARYFDEHETICIADDDQSDTQGFNEELALDQ